MTRIEALEKIAEDKASAIRNAEEAKKTERKQLITDVEALKVRIEELCKTANSVFVTNKEAFKAFFWDEIRQKKESSPYCMRFYRTPARPPVIACDYLYENNFHYQLSIDMYEIEASHHCDTSHRWIPCEPHVEQLRSFLLNFDDFEKAFYDKVDAFLNDNTVCHFNATMEPASDASEKSTKLPDIQQVVRKTVSVDVETTLTTNDVFNWLTACDDIATLRYLGKYAYRRISSLENPDDDDFRSRA